MNMAKEEKGNLVTVVVPVYNVERYLDECLNSLTSQTIPFDEIIVINDGSTDQSGEICNRYCSQCANMKLLSQENKGLGAARNIGIANASGDYIVFVDSDDYVSLDMNQKIKEYLRAYKPDVLYYSASMQYDAPAAEKPMKHSAELDYHVMTGKEYLYRAFPDSYSASACLAAYRINCLRDNNISFPENTYFEDNLFSLKVALEVQSICCVPDKFYIRRCRAGSIMMGEVNAKKCEDMVSVQHSLWECIKEKRVDIDNIDFACKFVFAGMLYAMGYLGQATDEIVRNGQIKKIVYTFFEMWISMFYREKLSFNQIAVFLAVLHETEKWNEKEQALFINIFWGLKEQYLAMRQQYREQLRMEVTGRMKAIPFQEKGRRIGVYGIGQHTKALLNLYQSLVSEIQCELYFIITKKSEDEFFGRPILAVSECRKIVDEIVISSKLYQQEMKDSLMREGVEENKVILLYNRDDICDLVIMNEILEF